MSIDWSQMNQQWKSNHCFVYPLDIIDNLEVIYQTKIHPFFGSMNGLSQRKRRIGKGNKRYEGELTLEQNKYKITHFIVNFDTLCRPPQLID